MDFTPDEQNPFNEVMDPFGIALSFSRLFSSWAKNPEELTDRLQDLALAMQETGRMELERFITAGTPRDPEKIDGNAAIVDFIKNNAMSARKYHSRYTRWFREFIEKTPGLEADERSRTLFWANQALSSMAPSNFFWTNPGAVKNYLDTEGASLASGMEAFLEDMSRRDNLAKLSDDSEFAIGESIAFTKGSVVARNELMELIQYAPATETTYDVPIVLIQPWINKYYIFDLSENNSFVRFLLLEGYTVFIVSWKNPGPEMRHITFSDYMKRGALAAVTAARTICREDHVHIAGYCIGGTAVAALMAWLNHEEGTVPVCDWTLFAALTDFSEPGELGIFTKEKGISFVESLVEEEGVLDKSRLGLTFRLLKSESLIWRSHVNNYLYGNPPPRSDMLYWNSDSTRLPAAMCSYYLRNFYLENRLVKEGGITLSGRPIDLAKIRQPLYAVGGLQDHISPWKGTFKTRQLVSCDSRYVLSADGHITGIVNPPSPRSKKRYWASNAGYEKDPEEWLADQKTLRGSWWEDWILWLRERSGKRGPPPSMGCEKYPPLEKAPGTYVFEK